MRRLMQMTLFGCAGLASHRNTIEARADQHQSGRNGIMSIVLAQGVIYITEHY